MSPADCKTLLIPNLKLNGITGGTAISDGMFYTSSQREVKPLRSSGIWEPELGKPQFPVKEIPAANSAGAGKPVALPEQQAKPVIK